MSHLHNYFNLHVCQSICCLLFVACHRHTYEFPIPAIVTHNKYLLLLSFCVSVAEIGSGPLPYGLTDMKVEIVM